MDIKKLKIQIVPILKKAGVKKSELFGSYARGDAKLSSDIDLLVDMPKGTTLIDLVGLQLELEDTLEKKVDLVTYGAISPLLKKYIDKDKKPIL